MKAKTSKELWVRFNSRQRGFHRFNSLSLPHLANHLVAFMGAVEALKREGMTWDEVRSFLEYNSGYGQEGLIYEAVLRVMEKPEWAESVRQWKEDALNRGEEKEALLTQWKAKATTTGTFCL